MAGVDELPRDVISAIEDVFRRLDATEGDYRLEFFASDGHLRKYARQEEGGRDGLVRYDELPLRPRGC
jgi:hypothetical protein